MTTNLVRGSSSAKTGTMKKQLLIVTDLGSFKAYAVDNSHLHSTARLELIEHLNPDPPHRKMADKLSAMAGRVGARIPAVILVDNPSTVRKHVAPLNC